MVIFPPEKDTAEGGDAHGETSEILEKPLSKHEQVGLAVMLLGEPRADAGCRRGHLPSWLGGVVKWSQASLSVSTRAWRVSLTAVVYPSIEAPGYKLQ